MAHRRLMSLLRLHSDKGQGYAHSAVYLESSHVAAIRPITSDHNRSDNRTVITLQNGLTEYVKESPDEVAEMVKDPTGPTATRDCK